MMKRILGFLLALCFALTCMGGALAEQAEPVPYNPGEITSAMFENLPSGTMSATDLGIFAMFDESFSENTGVDANTLAALTEVLDNATLHVSAGAYDDGVRIYLAGLYGYSESALSVDAALNITEAGLSVESNLIEGKKVTVTWETLLRLLGADDETIAALKSLTELTEEDVASALTVLLDKLSAFAEKAAEVASPYLEKVLEFAEGLPVETLEDVTDDSGYPAAAHVTVITCTDKAIGELLVSLADLLEQDAVLAPMLDQAIAGGMDITHNGVTATNTAEACALLRTAVAEELTDESRPLQLVLGADENGVPSSLTVIKEMEDGKYVAFIATLAYADDNTFYSLYLSAGTHLEDGSMEDGIAMTLTADVDSDGAVLVTTQMLGYIGGEVAMQQTQTESVKLSEVNGIPQQTIDYALSQTQEGLTMDVTMSGVANPNEEGGETIGYEGTMTVTADDSTVATDFAYVIISGIIEDEPTASMVLSMSTPDAGLDQYGIAADCYTYAYDPATTAALEEYALDTITSDDMDVLTTQASTALQDLLTKLMQALPEAFVAMMSE
ncbi:MAG: hypothetical protein MR821_03985 [Clostridiales bacterium]|nr:hypothetical protein [Clostridiales bacterium]